MKTTLSTILLFAASFTFASENAAVRVESDKTTGCTPLEVHFKSVTEIKDGNYKWSFSNGAMSTERNPSIVFLEAGTYEARLTVSNGAVTESSSVKITALGPPKTDFKIEKAKACANETMHFINTTVPTSSPVVSYVWGFGDGKTSTEPYVQHAYKTAGNYNVTLVATDANGCSSSRTTYSSIAVLPKPVAGFTPSTQSSCSESEKIAFANQSTGSNLSYSWNFNDNKGATDVNPIHLFNQGSYMVALAVKDENGCADSMMKRVSVTKLQPDFMSSKESSCAGEQVKFINTSAGRGSTCLWEFGDGTTSTQRNPNKIYSTPGNYTVKFTVKEGACSETATKTAYVKVRPGTEVSFKTSNNNSCSDVKNVKFENTTPRTALALWEFGDGTVSTQPVAEKVYDRTGNFSVGLTVTDSSGCTIKKKEENLVQTSVPMVGFKADTAGCAGSPLRFTNFTPNASSYLWSFGDGETSTSKNPTHIYKKNGYYTVSLTASNNASCDSTITLPNYVHVDNIKVDFDMAATPSPVPPFVCRFKNMTADAGMKFVWDFGDGSTEASTNPVHIYDAPGSFDVRLVAYNKTGCSNAKVFHHSIEMGTSMTAPSSND